MKITTQQRVNWLLKNQRLWSGYGGAAVHSPETTTDIEQRVFTAMQRDGLLSEKTTLVDCAIWRWISKARKQRRNERATGASL